MSSSVDRLLAKCDLISVLASEIIFECRQSFCLGRAVLSYLLLTLLGAVRRRSSARANWVRAGNVIATYRRQRCARTKVGFCLFLQTTKINVGSRESNLKSHKAVRKTSSSLIRTVCNVLF